MAKRVAEMDMARGLATLAVVIIHVSADPLIENVRGGGVTWLYLALNVASRFAVPTFVMLSGMGLALSSRPERYFSFERRRLAKLLPAYVLWSVIFSLTYSYHQAIGTVIKVPKPISIKIVTELVTGKACYHLYFIPIIVMLYLLFPLLHKALRTWPGLIASALITGTAISITRYVDLPDWAYTLLDIRSPLNWLFYFAFGIKLAHAANLDVLKQRQWKLVISAAFFVCLVVMLVIVRRLAVATGDIEEALEALGPIIMLYTVLFTAWVWSLGWGNGAMAAGLRWISQWSYMIYLSHPLALMLYVRLYTTFYKSSDTLLYGVGGMVSVAVATAVFVGVSTLARRLVPGRVGG